jgi:hypothetical protein
MPSIERFEAPRFGWGCRRKHSGGHSNFGDERVAKSLSRQTCHPRYFFHPQKTTYEIHCLHPSILFAFARIASFVKVITLMNHFRDSYSAEL